MPVDGWNLLWFIPLVVVICVIVIVGFFVGLPNLLLVLARWGRQAGYNREARRRNKKAKIHNEKARQLRLQRTTYDGIPLPPADSKEGEMTITEMQMLLLPSISLHALEQVLFDRGRDMGVNMEILVTDMSRDVKVRWRQPKPGSKMHIYNSNIKDV